MEEDNLISVIDLARQLGRRRQTLFKVIKGLRIETHSRTGNEESRGQKVAYITKDDANRITDKLRVDEDAESNGETKEVHASGQKGVFCN